MLCGCAESAIAQSETQGAGEPGNALRWAPEAASSVAGRVDAIFDTELVLSVVIAGTIAFLIIVFCIKYRRGVPADRSNPPEKNVIAETLWIGLPTLIGLVMSVWAARVYFDMYNAPPGAIPIFVVAKQWMWKIQHPEGAREINALHIPVGQPVKLTMISQDVIHSFFVPEFRIKQDVLPGRETSIWFEATRAGTYHLMCAQYCGLNHSRMQGQVYALEPADYERWLSEQTSQATMAAEGEKLFREFGCSGCHGASATVRAPSLNGIYGKPVPLLHGQVVTADDRYIHDSILLPKAQVAAGYQNVMPSFKGVLSEEQVAELVAYIRSLGSNAPQPDTLHPVGSTSRNTIRLQQQSVQQRALEYHHGERGSL